MPPIDEGTQAVREIRRRISRELANDPDKLVSHYLRFQQSYAARLLDAKSAEQASAADEATPRS